MVAGNVQLVQEIQSDAFNFINSFNSFVFRFLASIKIKKYGYMVFLLYQKFTKQT